jgi:hypothetical protein
MLEGKSSDLFRSMVVHQVESSEDENMSYHVIRNCLNNKHDSHL